MSLFTWRRRSCEHTGYAAGKFISTLLSTRQDTMLREVNFPIQLLTLPSFQKICANFIWFARFYCRYFQLLIFTHQYSVVLEIVGRRSFYFRAKLLEKTNRYCRKDKSLSLSTGRLVLGIQSVTSLESKLYTALTR